MGTTPGVYVNRTLIKCLTPDIKDDSDIGYEEVSVEIALNGNDFVTGDDVVFTFIGPNAGKMLWVYILMTIFAALLIIVVAALLSSYWNKIALQLQETRSRNVYTGEQPHIVNKIPRYLVQDLLSEKENQERGSEQGNKRSLNLAAV